MSKKKKRNQKKSSFEGSAAESNNTSVPVEITDSNPPDPARFAYLKQRWWILGLILLLSLGALGAGLKYLEDDAQRQKLLPKKDQNLLSSINLFLSAPPPSPTPQLSKEYIYAGSKLLAVEDVNANAAPPADLAVWRPSSGTWWVLNGQNSQYVSQAWGVSTDDTAPGDYDGDGKTDFCVFRPSSGEWWVLKSSDGSYYSVTFGQSGDKVAPADYDGDGKSDLGVFRPSNGTWHVKQSISGNTATTSLGTSGDIPTAADFDGDGRADLSVWRNSNANFYTIKSSNNPQQQYTQTQYGQTGDKPICGDYDGDGRADMAVWRSTTWYILQTSNNQTAQYTWGNTSWDKPVQNDYDGDGKVDIAVWRATESTQGAGDVGKWFIRNSSTGGTRIVQWGTTGDLPVPVFYKW